MRNAAEDNILIMVQSDTVKKRIPYWIKSSFKHNALSVEVKNILKHNKLHTICQSGKCPNIWECFSEKTAAIMILGDICTRNCRFCSVDKGDPVQVELEESSKVAEFVHKLQLEYVVITSVTRDDLLDGGALHFYNTITEIRRINSQVKIEVLTPDFKGDRNSVRKVLEAKPEVYGHNIETVSRLYEKVRSQADYNRSLDILGTVKDFESDIYTKSGIMLGLGETKEEVLSVLDDLRQVSCDFVTIGQYLKPSKNAYEVQEFITPEIFKQYKVEAEKRGFLQVMTGPLVRSSYRAKDFFTKN